MKRILLCILFSTLLFARVSNTSVSLLAYAEMAVGDNSVETNISGTGWVVLTPGITCTITRNITFIGNSVNALATVELAGIYYIRADCSFTIDGTNKVGHVGISIDGADPLADHVGHRTIGTPGNIGFAACGALLTLTANSTIGIMVKNSSSGADDFTMEHMNWIIERISDI